MAAIISSQTAFSANEQITSAKLNNILAQSSFDAGALTGDGTLTLVSGQMQVSILKTANLPASIINQTMIGTNVVGKGPLFSYSVGSNQTIPANSGTILTNYTTSGGDTNNSFSSSAFTAPVAGWYSFLATAETGTANTNFAVYITSNGTLVLHGPQLSATTLKTGVFGILLLSVGDVVKLNAVCSNSIVVNGGYFSGFMIRSA
jgi:hypothetical protein